MQPSSDPSSSAPEVLGGNSSRREFLRLLGLGFLASYTVIPFSKADAANGNPKPPFLITGQDEGAIFPQSVASGDPTPSGVILWTRIAPEMAASTELLGLEIAFDPEFKQRALRVRVPASEIAATLDYTVRIDLDKQLEANTIYYYRFIYRGIASRTGRCRTLPRKNDKDIASLKLAVVNCQDYTNGYYGAYGFIANDDSIDFVLHLGDFIYETTGNTSFQGAQNRPITLPSGGTVALNLADYRTLYRTYRSDPNLRAALENFTWMTIWDDHEMANDQYHDYVNNSQGAPDHPYTTDTQYKANSVNLLRQLKFDSQQAWFEYGAVRVRFNASAQDIFGRLQIYRNFRFGDLVELFLTDERTYRSSHPVGESVPGVPSGFAARYFAPVNPAQLDPSRTMLGADQRTAFVDGVTGSKALWKAWGNEVLLGALQVVVTPSIRPALPAFLLQLLPPTFAGALTVDNDSWDGYQADRNLIAKAFKTAGVENLVVLTGDLHTYVASYFKADFGQASNTDESNVVGVEYMTPAITSSNLQEQLGLNAQQEGGLELLATAQNPHLVYLNSHQYGYATVKFTRAHCDYTMYAVDKSQPNPPAPVVVKKFRTPAGKPLIKDITSKA